MRDILERKYHEQMNDLELDPSDRVWERLESRLDQDTGKVRAVTFRRWMSIAASVAVLAVSYALFHGHQKDDLIMEDIDAMPQATFTAYKYVNECHIIYGGHQWKTVDVSEEETPPGQIKTNPDFGSSLN